MGGAINGAVFRDSSETLRRFLTGGSAQYYWANGELRLSKWKMSGAQSRPYHAAFVLLLHHAMQEAPANSRISFTLDRHNINESLSRKQFDEVIARKFLDNTYNKQLGDLVYSDSKDNEGLQMADLRAFVWNRFFERRMDNTPELSLAMKHIVSSQSVALVEQQHVDKMYSDTQ